MIIPLFNFSKKKQLDMKWAPYFLLFIGGIFTPIGIFFIFDSYQYIVQGEKTTGQVIEIKESYNDDHQLMYSPVVNFITNDGKQITYASGFRSSINYYQLGQPIEVYYLNTNPQKVRINSFMDLWFFPILFSGLGGLLLIFSLAWIFRNINRAKEIQWLKNFGQAIETDLVEVKRSNVKINGQYLYHVYSKWQNPQNGENCIFKSDAVYENQIPRFKDTKIKVWIDPIKPQKRFYLEIVPN